MIITVAAVMAVLPALTASVINLKNADEGKTGIFTVNEPKDSLS